MFPNNRIWSEENVKISDEIENSALISEKDFEQLKNLYKFVYISEYKAFFDRKWKKVVAKQTDFFKNSDMIINKDWIITELFRTGSTTIMNLCKNNIELNDIYNKYCKAKKKEQLAFKEYFDRKRSCYELEENNCE